MTVHQRKLEEIATRNKKGQQLDKRAHSVFGAKAGRAVGKEMKRYKMDKARTKDFNTVERNYSISKDNQILLSKLVEISSGKQSALPKLSTKRSVM